MLMFYEEFVVEKEDKEDNDDKVVVFSEVLGKDNDDNDVGECFGLLLCVV